MQYSLPLYLKEKLKSLLLNSSSAFCVSLDKNETRLLPFLDQLYKTDSFKLDSLKINEEKISFGSEITYPDSILFEISALNRRNLSILPSGGICIENEIINTGFQQYYNIFGYLQGYLKNKNKISGTIIANWPQRFLTYGDFVLQLLPELCLIKSIITHDEWLNAKFVLPNPPRFMFEYLKLIGCNENQLIDSKKSCFRVVSNSKLYFREKDIMWFLCAPPQLIDITRNYFIPFEIRPSEKIIFVERLRGYRKAVGLTENVRERLREIGVDFFDAARASIKTQIETFASAKIVIGIHGAGMANTMWCQKGTKIVEFFHPSFAPWCYAILANQLGLDYYCVGGQLGYMDINFRESDINVDWSYLLKLIERLKKE